MAIPVNFQRFQSQNEGPPVINTHAMLSSIGDPLLKAQENARKQAKENEQRAALSEAAQELESGTYDHNKLAAKLLKLGQVDAASAILKRGEEKALRLQQAAAGEEFSNALSSMFGGGGTSTAPQTPRANISGAVHHAETEEDVQRLERATGMNVGPDLDKIVRTVYGEAGGEGAVGQQAVAGVIMNRAKQSGMTPTDVVLAKSQFEPWWDAEARARMERLDPNSPEYQRIKAAIEPVITGQAPDPTGGADHFYAPETQAALGRKAPSWDDGTGRDIGNHRFFKRGYNPSGPVQVADIPAAGAQPTQFQIPGAPTAQAPSGTATDAAALGLPQQLSRRIPLLMRAASNPNLPEGQRQLANTLLKEALDESRLTNDQKEYLMARTQGYQGTLLDYLRDLRKAGAQNINVGGGSDKQIFDTMEKSAEAARAAATGFQAIQQARQAVEAGGIFGAGADQRLALQKLGVSLGLADPERIVNTETFRAAIAPQVAAMLKATVGNIQVSNADREFAEKAAGGAITLDEKSIKRLLDVMERGNRAVLEQHQKRLEAVYPDGGNFVRERALFGVQAPSGAPVRVTTPDEARQLPKGTRIILPDGSEGVVP